MPEKAVVLVPSKVISRSSSKDEDNDDDDDDDNDDGADPNKATIGRSLQPSPTTSSPCRRRRRGRGRRCGLPVILAWWSSLSGWLWW